MIVMRRVDCIILWLLLPGHAAHAVPPTVVAEVTRVATDASANDVAATCVALDGSRLVFGARGRDEGGVNRGAIYVHRESSTGWIQSDKLTPQGSVDREEFGTAVASSGDWIAVGAPLSDRDEPDGGSVWLFQNNGVSFLQFARLSSPSAVAGGRFGCSLAFSSGAEPRLIVGARREAADGISGAGSVYVYRFIGGAWALEARLIAPAVVTEADDFGQSVAVFGDTIVVGAPGEDAAGTNSGGVHVFRLVGSTWAHEAFIVSPMAEPLAEFGSSVALDGERLVIGAYREDGGAPDAGRVHLFSRVSSGWTAVGTLTSPAPSVSAEFGGCVAIQDDAIAVGSSRLLVNGQIQAGGAFLFRLSAMQWSTVATLVSSNSQANEFAGCDVGLSGLRIAFGAPLKTITAAYQGAALVTDLSSDCDGDLIPDRAELAGGAPDCNANGRPDACDIASGEPDTDGNGVPDSCEVVPCPADLTGNGVVTGADLSILLAVWAESEGFPPADLNGDGVVSGLDLAVLLAAWGPCP